MSCSSSGDPAPNTLGMSTAVFSSSTFAVAISPTLQPARGVRHPRRRGNRVRLHRRLRGGGRHGRVHHVGIGVGRRRRRVVDRIGPVGEGPGAVRRAVPRPWTGRPHSRSRSACPAGHRTGRSRWSGCRPPCARSAGCGYWRGTCRCPQRSLSRFGMSSRSDGTFGLSRKKCTLSNVSCTTCLIPLPSLHETVIRVIRLSRGRRRRRVRWPGGAGDAETSEQRGGSGDCRDPPSLA